MNKMVIYTLILLAFTSCKKENNGFDYPEGGAWKEKKTYSLTEADKITATSDEPCVIYFEQLFDSDTGMVRNVYRINSDGTGREKAFDFPYPRFGIIPSPDGRYVPFNKVVNSESGDDELMLYDMVNNDTLFLGITNKGVGRSGTMPVSFWLDTNRFFYEEYKNYKSYLYNVKTRTKEEIKLPYNGALSSMRLVNGTDIIDPYGNKMNVYDTNFNLLRTDTVDNKIIQPSWPYASASNKRIGFDAQKSALVIYEDGKLILNWEDTGIKESGLCVAMGPYGKWIYYHSSYKVEERVRRSSLKRVFIDDISRIEDIYIAYDDLDNYNRETKYTHGMLSPTHIGIGVKHE